MSAELVIFGVYGLIFVLLAVYGVHRSYLVWLYYRHRRNEPRITKRFDDLPQVTVQLPVFNEMYVVERLIDATVALDYPRDKLQIQVLDDSTDETTAICARKVAEHREAGHDIVHIHRTDRTGFKAGALEDGTKTATGEFIFVFDADFIPNPEILQETIHHFTDPKVGMVQARWDHLNREHSMLTEVQALMLDGHFIMEHTARNRADLFFNFNGTAGVWRKKAIEDAGGWQHDTLTEDLDLSYRAQLKGWRFVYLKDVLVPAELPVEMNAFKSQQFRWAKGSIQVGRKLLPRVLRSEIPFKQKAEAFYHLTNNMAYPLLMLLSVMLLPCLMLRTTHGWREVVLVDLPLFFGTTLSVVTFYLTTRRESQPSPSAWTTLKSLPMLLAVGIGLSINQSRAVFEAFLGRTTGFVRTPKHGVVGKGDTWRTRKYRGSLTIVPFVELFFTVYFIVTLILVIERGRYTSIPFVLLFLSGFAYVGILSMSHGLRRGRRSTTPAPEVVPATTPTPRAGGMLPLEARDRKHSPQR